MNEDVFVHSLICRATILAKARNIEHLTNAQVFLQANKVVAQLEAHKIDACLEWCGVKVLTSTIDMKVSTCRCHDNKSKLRRIHSTLDLRMREQEFIELIRANRRFEAVQYARKHFANADSDEWLKNNLPKLTGDKTILTNAHCD